MRLFYFLIFCISVNSAALASGFNSPLKSMGISNPLDTMQVMTAEQALMLDFSQDDEGTLELVFTIAPDHKLYKSRIALTSDADLGEMLMPAGEWYDDPELGPMEVYHDKVVLRVPVYEAKDGEAVNVRFQGCSLSLCFQPVEQTVYLKQVEKATSAPRGETALPEPSTKPGNPYPGSKENKEIDAGSSSWGIFAFFALGLGLAFTPCVFPMYPIMSSVVIGKGARSSWRTLSLSMGYVQGMAVVYSLIGVVVAMAGVKFQIALQHPGVTLTVAALFLILSGGMFGLYHLQLPGRYQNAMNAASQKQQGGSLGGAVAMGALSGLVASPCTTAPLAGILMFIATSGDAVTGFLSLYLLSMGMGVPMILFAVTGGKLLPKAGAWMDVVKHAFGFALLLVSVYFASRVVDEIYTNTLYALVGMAMMGYLYVKNAESAPSVLKGVRFVVSVVGLVAMTGFVAVQFAPGTFISMSTQEDGSVSRVEFEKIDSESELQAALNDAKMNGQAVMLDLYADWCSACIQYEKNTFTDPGVVSALSPIRRLQIDMSENSDWKNAFQNEMNIVGLPTIVFVDQEGQELESERVTGYLDAPAFESHIEKVVKPAACQAAC